jgi:histone-lysine N-methyltransferase SETMAR
MEQCAVIRFFTFKGLSPRDIHTELISVYGYEVLDLRAVYKWHERFMQGRTELFDNPRSGRPLQNDLADAIRAMIQEFLFTSCKRLCIHIRIAKATYLRIFQDVLQVKKFNLRWVPHFLDDAQKAERVSLSTDILKILKENQKTRSINIITGDESWFYFEYPHQSVWAPSRDELPERIKQKIGTEKCLISVIWSVNGIDSLLDVPKGTTYNTTFFCDVVIPDLLENVCAGSRRRTLKGIVMQLDDARVHNSKKSNECLTEFRTRRVPPPAYSPNVVPSDFFLFGTVKAELQNYEIHSREDLILAIRTVFGQMAKETLISVYVSWKERLK